MAFIGNGWQNVMTDYSHSIENLTKMVLEQIKEDRTRNNLPFDDSFNYFLRGTSTR